MSFHRFRHCALFELLTQRPNHTIAATTPHPLNASALAQSAAMPVSHGTFQPCAGMSVASVSSFIAGASPINNLRPAAFIQRTGKTTFADLRSVRLRGNMSRLWHGQLGIEPTARGFGDRVATLEHLPAYLVAFPLRLSHATGNYAPKSRSPYSVWSSRP